MSGWRGRTANAALVPAVGLVALVGLVVQSRGIDTAAEWAALPVVLLSSGALYVRRRHPVPVGVVALAAVGAYGALLHRPGPIMLVFVVALYTVVDEGYLAVAIGLGLASVIAFAVADSYNRSPNSMNGATLLHAGWLVAVIVGVTRNRRAYLAEAQARAVVAEQRMEEEARRRATEERLRIARELHDVLGHHLSLINVQASAALHRPDPVRSEQALTAIKQTSKETLHELRATLGVLRSEAAGGGRARTRPVPPRRSGQDGRPAGVGDPHRVGRDPVAAAGGRPGGVSDRPGSAHQRGASRWCHRRGGPGPARPRRRGRGGRGRRHQPTGHAGQRDPRNAGAGTGTGRFVDHWRAAGRRLPGLRPAADAARPGSVGEQA